MAEQVDAYRYHCPRCHRSLRLAMAPMEFRAATGSFVRCPHDGEVLVYKGLAAELEDPR